MGKLSGIAGTMRGRVGSLVYSKGENGTTYVRQYQPQVFNPRTPEQLVQRAKMNLAGQLSSLTSRAIVRAMAVGNNRKCRGVYVNRLLREITVTTQAGNYVAKISVPSMTFSRGSAQLHAEATQIQAGETTISVELEMNDTARAGLYGERIVVVSIVPRTVSEFDFITSADILLSDTGTRVVEVNLPHALMSGQKVHVFRCPYELSDGEASVIAERLYGVDSDEEAQAVVSSHLAVASSIWGDSSYAGVVTYSNE
jgi:hypothetical protein